MSYTANQIAIYQREWISREALRPAERLIVAMVLMNRHDNQGTIQNRNSVFQGPPDHPGIPVAMSNNQCRYLCVHSSSEKKEVNPELILLKTIGQNELPQLFPPIWVSEVDQLGYVRVPTLPNNEKALLPAAGLFEHPPEIAHQHDVAVGITEVVMARQLACASEDVIELLCAGFVALHIRLMAEA